MNGVGDAFPRNSLCIHSSSQVLDRRVLGYAVSCEIKDLIVANNACMARALSVGVAAESLVKDLKKFGFDQELR